MAQDRSLDDMVIFSADDDNRVPGELVVKLTEEGQRNVAESIPSGPITRLAGPLPTSFGIDNLDRVLGDLRVTSVTRVHAVVSPLAFDTAEAGTLAADVNATYRLRLANPPSDRQLERLRSGVDLDDGPTAPAEVKRVDERELEMTIREGRKRQLRRMADAVGNSVETLIRIRFGPVALGRLQPGEARRLSSDEVEALWKDSPLMEDDG